MTDANSVPSLAGLACWTLTEGHVGMETQTRALAAALGLDPVVKRAPAPAALGWLPARLWPFPLAIANARGADLSPPWPDVLITCGRRSVPLALAIKRRHPATWCIHIQNPRVPLARFDTVVVPAHDGVTGDNVVTCLGSIHGLAPERFAAEADAFRARFAGLKRPLVTVLVGGANRAYGIGGAEMARLADALAELVRRQGCGLAVVPSRRTGSDNVEILRTRLAGTEAYVWDGVEANPYLALIGLADALVVTCDSVNMVCEAAASEKPVYVMMYPGRSARFDAFHQAMRARGHARPFEGAVDFAWRPVPLREIRAAAAEIARRIRG